MVEFRIKVHPAQRQTYMPKELVEALGLRLKVRPNRYAAVTYPEDVDLTLVVKSLELLLQDFKLELEARAKSAI